MNTPSGPSVFLGIDVSKVWIDAFLLPQETTWRVSNEANELQSWVDQLPDGITLAVLEATGGLEMQPAVALAQAGRDPDGHCQPQPVYSKKGRHKNNISPVK